MYMSMEAMKLLSGTQDVYLTDFKYGNDACALKYSKVPNYWKMVTRNHKLAFADAELIIRHLLLPTHIECCTRPVLTWIAENLGPMIRVNLMGQYRPEYKAHEFMELRRHPTSEEMSEAFEIAREVGLKNVIG
jgi:putative pyruvate formate lyase activating enzyme